MSIYVGINQLIIGTQFYVVLLLLFYVLGFIISLKPKYSYYGYSALSASTCMMLYFSITNKLFKMDNNYIFIISGIISIIILIPFIFLIHYKNININKSIILSILIYPFTYFTLYFIESIDDINSIKSGETFILLLSLFMVMLSLAILINRGVRENNIQKLFNYSDLQFFSSLKNKLIVTFNGYDDVLEIIISDFKNSILSYVEGDYSKAIINLYISIEGIKRIYEHVQKMDFSTTGYKKEFDDILKIRSKIAHSNIGTKNKIYSKYQLTEEEVYNAITTGYKIISSDLSNARAGV